MKIILKGYTDMHMCDEVLKGAQVNEWGLNNHFTWRKNEM